MRSEFEAMHGDLSAGVEVYAARSDARARLRRLRDAQHGFDAAGWLQAGALGWPGLLVPERMGGSGFGLAEAAVVMRSAGRALLPEPLVAGAVLAGGILARSARDEAHALLARLLRGETFVAVAWQEALGDLSCAAVGTTAQEGRLTGAKSFVALGAAASGWLVSARDARGVGIYWVESGTTGATYSSIPQADGSEHGTLRLDGVEARPSMLVIAHGEGEAALTEAVDASIVAQAAGLLGIGERALELTLDHLRTRVQFGKPIGSFQVLQHRCVDLFVRKELGAAALESVLAEWPCAAADRRSALASRVKARCADAALDICRQAVQMHGAMGFTDECDIGLYLKRALVDSAWLGNAQLHRRRYARLALCRRGTTRSVEAA